MMTQQMGAFSIGFTELEQGRIDCTAAVMRLLGAVVVRAEAKYAEGGDRVHGDVAVVRRTAARRCGP